MPRSALILVDLENEWTIKGSSYYVGNLRAFVARANTLIDACRKRGYRIIFIRHVEKGSRKEFADGTKRTELLAGLHSISRDKIITKYTIGAFESPEAARALRGIKNVVVAGILTNLCVRKFVEDAYDKGFQIAIIEDCCTAFDKKKHHFTLDDLKATREEIEIISLKNFISRS